MSGTEIAAGAGIKSGAETPNTVHGRLLEAVHISGYSFERACSELEWLLDEERWKRVGGGLDDINAFLATIDLSEFRIAIDQRKKLAKRLADIQASQRATAKMLGVDKETVARDLGVRPGANAPPVPERPTETGAVAEPPGANAPAAWFQSDIDPAALARKQTEREARIAGHGDRHEAIRTAAAEAGAAVDQAALAGPFALIYADPPWAFETYSWKGKDISPEKHYPVLPDDEIAGFTVAGRPVAEIAHRDAVLFLWCTSSNIHRALPILAAWGFTYKTQAVWVKDRTGTGYWFLNQHEVLLVGARGDIPAPMQPLPASVFQAKRGRHSEKPRIVRATIERMFPHFDATTRLELFAREPSPGWTVHGFEAHRLAS
jgi:N6-adenosine-specific RNA methylase IME4